MQASDRQLSELARLQLDCPVLFGSISEANGRAPGQIRQRDDSATPYAYAPLNELAMVAILSEN